MIHRLLETPGRIGAKFIPAPDDRQSVMLPFVTAIGFRRTIRAIHEPFSHIGCLSQPPCACRRSAAGRGRSFWRS